MVRHSLARAWPPGPCVGNQQRAAQLGCLMGVAVNDCRCRQPQHASPTAPRVGGGVWAARPRLAWIRRARAHAAARMGSIRNGAESQSPVARPNQEPGHPPHCHGTAMAGMRSAVRVCVYDFRTWRLVCTGLHRAPQVPNRLHRVLLPLGHLVLTFNIRPWIPSIGWGRYMTGIADSIPKTIRPPGLPRTQLSK